MIDFSFTDEQLLLQRTTREFAQKEVRPVCEELEKNADPAKAAAPLELYKKAAQLGYTKMKLPRKYGGSEMSSIDMFIVMEEMGAADSGFAGGILMMNVVPGILAAFGTEEQCLEWIGGPDSEERLVIGAGSTTEPDCGNEVMCLIPDPKFGIKTTAVREGDEWVINGQKAPFCSCASHKDSQFYIVMARTDLTKPPAESLTRFLVPAGTPGLSVAVDNLTDKIGDRCLTNAEVNYNDVRVPKENMLGEEGKALPFPPGIHAKSGGAGAMSIGLARAAFEYAVDYAKQRVTWGQPIIKHEAIATMLADMQMQLESARALCLRAAWNADLQEATGKFTYNTWNSLAGVNASEMAIRVTQMAMSILGGHGIIKDFPVEKWVRDAFIGRPSGYDNIIQRLNIAAGL